jgi:hypothetical protein
VPHRGPVFTRFLDRSVLALPAVAVEAARRTRRSRGSTLRGGWTASRITLGEPLRIWSEAPITGTPRIARHRRDQETPRVAIAG